MPKTEWPKPTVADPTEEEMIEMGSGGGCEATDGCCVEPDGVCPHGHPSWLLYYGLI